MMNKSGFTIIELMVVITIGLLITGGSVVSYNKFIDQQRLNQSVLLLKAKLEQAHAYAVSSKKPADCTNFQGFKVELKLTTTPNSYIIGPVCDGTMLLPETTLLPVEIIFESTLVTDFIFYPLTLGTSLENDMRINLKSTRTSRNNGVLIFKSGSIGSILRVFISPTPVPITTSTP